LGGLNKDLAMPNFLKSVLAIALCAFASNVFARPILRAGDAAPPSFGSTVSGDEIRTENLSGKIIVATFWASWCAPCRQEISVLARVRKAVSAQNVEIVAINFGEDRRIFVQASKKLLETGLTITHDRNYRLSKPLGIDGIPYMLLIDHAGKIKYIHQGFGSQSLGILVDEINLMLKTQHDDNIGKSENVTTAAEPKTHMP
jgi:thiol-disulfide isomerase/thioredoxin